MTAFVNKLFTPKSFEGDFVLVANMEGKEGKKIVMPDGFRYVIYSSLEICFSERDSSSIHMYSKRK